MKKTYEMEKIDKRGNVVKTRLIIEDDVDRYEYEGYLGDQRTPFVNKYSTFQDRSDYEKYASIMHRSSMDLIREAYEDFLKCIEDF